MGWVGRAIVIRKHVRRRQTQGIWNIMARH